MRSLTVVLPASMCAMMPMLRTRVTSVFLPAGFLDMGVRNSRLQPASLTKVCAWRVFRLDRCARFLHRDADQRRRTLKPNRGGHRCPPRSVSASRLPGEVAERLVRLGHLVDVLALGERAALALGRGDELLGERDR